MNSATDCLAVAALQCSNLGYTVAGKALLQGVELTVQRGEKLGIVGPNGSGKSTLLKLLAGLLAASSGEVLLQGQALKGMRRRDVAQRLAVVEQQAETHDAICVRDAVELGRTPWLGALAPWGPTDDQVVCQALRDVQLEHLEKRRWHSLSGGERQRVHIARALAQRPSILLLDEPTNHLDIQQQLSLLRLVQALPITTVIALHDLNQALACDRIAVLEGGRLVALGAPAAVLTPGLLQRTFKVRGHWLQDPTDGTQVLRLQPLADQSQGLP